MAPSFLQLSLRVLPLCFLLSSSPVSPATFTVVNQCDYTVWPGILTGAGTSPLSPTGFSLGPGESQSLTVPTSWSGRLWGRSGCSNDPAGKFSCVTGDCGSGVPECNGSGAKPPATLAEFTLNGSGGQDFYDVSLVDGYNLPMQVAPKGGTGSCSVTDCPADVNSVCPPELRMTADGNDQPVACRSACEAFGSAEYCCNGDHGTPDTCVPSEYAQAFKRACPLAYSYAYDDHTSTFTCTRADYVITFCASSSPSEKTSGGQNTTTGGGGGTGGGLIISSGVSAAVPSPMSIWALLMFASPILQQLIHSQ
ncbi:unnamed protein product [Cuscuta campestris]|uniref:Thaumatin-like protein 1 n=1 Tax=Cuscuta campestris TaxID=132261 RepID=A0A484LGC6_9ASTE|nr:unnamed protein product [Cuscuta campestris]